MMNKKSKAQKGITLIALIITIVVLLILAVVAIGAVRDDGIIQYAKNSTNEYEKGMEKEQSVLDSYLAKIEGGVKISKAVDNVYDENVTIIDSYGNTMVLPAGFKILVDDTTSYNAETINVTKGIVIEDVTAGNIKDETTGELTNPTVGSQFVWIPVGNVYYSETEYKTITLGRYTFSSSETTDSETGETILAGTPSAYSGSNTEDTVANHNSSYKNAIAKDIEAFIRSANNNGGYYLGRYEARDGVTTSARTSSTSDTNKMVCKKDSYVYNYVTQSQASSLSQGMYTSSNFTSDLINSYAWDTAIVFLQEFDDRADKTTPYSRLNSLNNTLSTNGTTLDEICNIYDMASNCMEWSTETNSSAGNPCVYRGGHYGGSYNITSTRGIGKTSFSYDLYCFRPLLYV